MTYTCNLAILVFMRKVKMFSRHIWAFRADSLKCEARCFDLFLRPCWSSAECYLVSRFREPQHSQKRWTWKIRGGEHFFIWSFTDRQYWGNTSTVTGHIKKKALTEGEDEVRDFFGAEVDILKRNSTKEVARKVRQKCNPCRQFHPPTRNLGGSSKMSCRIEKE